MKGIDRSLLAILLGAIVLVVIALIVVARQPEPSYRADDAPDAVVHNYLLAIAKADYERAWGTLSPTLANYPKDTEAFVDDIFDRSWDFHLGAGGGARSFSVEPADIAGDRAVVEVSQSTFRQSGLFDSTQISDDFTMELARESGGWRLIDGEASWYDCWSDPSRCNRDEDAPTPERDQ